MGIVGGNLAEIGANEGSLKATGGMALTTGTETGSAAQSLETAVAAATRDLVSRFEQLASDMNAEIKRASTQLQSTDWKGNSREQAIAIEANLKGKVANVLTTSTAAINDEKKAFCDRAGALVTEVNERFTKVMGDIDREYGALADAAKLTMDNFEAADQTIRIG